MGILSIDEEIRDLQARHEALKGYKQSYERELEETRLDWSMKWLAAKRDIKIAERALFLLERYINNGFAVVQFKDGTRREVRPYNTGNAVTTLFNLRGDIWKLAADVVGQEPS